MSRDARVTVFYFQCELDIQFKRTSALVQGWAGEPICISFFRAPTIHPDTTFGSCLNNEPSDLDQFFLANNGTWSSFTAWCAMPTAKMAGKMAAAAKPKCQNNASAIVL
jgi:hypothetical protein